MESLTGLPTYAEAYAARYPDTIVTQALLAAGAASLITFRRPAGRYPSGPTSDFSLTLIQSGASHADRALGTLRRRLTVPRGQLLLFPPFVASESRWDAIATGAVVSVRHARVAELLKDLSCEPCELFRDLYVRPFIDPFVSTTIAQLLMLRGAGEAAERMFEDAAILAIFASLARLATRETVCARRGLADWQLRRVLEKLGSLQDVSLAELAEAANLSPFYFARAFKETTGMPPRHYQQCARIDKAQELLTTTNLPVTDIALQVGYGSSQTLARVFRKSVGATPVQFRRRHAP